MGYWLWKPHLILQTLEQVPTGDFVLYTDAGVDIVSDPDPLFQQLDARDIGLFRQFEPAGHWSKRDAFVLMDADEERYWSTPILNAAFMVFRSSAQSRRFVREWFDYCTDRRILTDDPNTCGLANLIGFKDHRHDQAVLTILAEKWSLVTSPDPSQKEGQEPLFHPIFDHHRRRNRPLLAGVRSKLQLGTKLRRLLNVP